MVVKIDHIGIAVDNLDEAKKFYEEILGLKIQKIEEVSSQNVKVAFIPIGESKIELLESLNTEGPIAKFIAKKGPGVHHIAIEVNNIENTLKNLREKDIKLIDEKPREGANGNKIAFVHPKSTNGVLLELCEKK